MIPTKHCAGKMHWCQLFRYEAKFVLNWSALNETSNFNKAKVMVFAVIWSYNIQSIISFLKFLWFCRFRCANGSLAKSCGKPQVLGRVDHGGELLVCFFKGGDFFSWYLNYVTKNELCYGFIFLKLMETLVLLVYKRLKVCAIDFGLRGLGFTPGRVISVPCRGGGRVGGGKKPG